jgi:flavin reductase (DIM6/NTAB) family NADH-FMN oxidoreductase RutF
MYHSRHSPVDLRDFRSEDRYKFLMGTVIPRPIALVTSLSEEGVLNAAPFSQFVVISVDPALLGFVAHELPTGHKDTVRNALKSGEFVINTVNESMAAQVQQCSISYPPSVSEVAEVGFHTLPSLKVQPQRIAESHVHFECRLHRSLDFGSKEEGTMLIVGEIVVAHCAQGVLSGHRVDHAAVNALGRIAGRSYCRTRERIDV